GAPRTVPRRPLRHPSIVRRSPATPGSGSVEPISIGTAAGLPGSGGSATAKACQPKSPCRGAVRRRTPRSACPAGVSCDRIACSRTAEPWPDHQPASEATTTAPITGRQPKAATKTAPAAKTATMAAPPHQRAAAAPAQVAAPTATTAHVRPSTPRVSRNGDGIPQVGQLGFADAGHLEQVFDLVEAAARVPMGDDPLRQHRADPGQRLELGRGGGVEVNAPVVGGDGAATGPLG